MRGASPTFGGARGNGHHLKRTVKERACASSPPLSFRSLLPFPSSGKSLRPRPRLQHRYRPLPRHLPQAWYEEITVNGFLSLWYEYNTNNPASSRNQYRVFDYDHNTFNVDAAELVVQKPVAKAGDVGFRIDAVAGAVARVASAAGLFQGQDFDLQQATVSWIAPVGSGLRLDFGKFVTHMGNELIEGYDGWNDNATRSFSFGYAIPFTHAGLKATTSFGDHLTAMLALSNGWDVVEDNNSGKSLGASSSSPPRRRSPSRATTWAAPSSPIPQATGATSATSWASGSPPTGPSSPSN